MRVADLTLCCAVLAAAAACADDLTQPGTGAAPELRGGPGSDDAGPVSVMTQNLYIGANVDAVIAALASPDPTDDVPALVAALQTLGETDFPSRAAGLADEVARRRPDAIALQEVSEIHVDLTPLGLAVKVDIDFLPILLSRFQALGLDYTVAATVKNIEAAPIPGVSLVDYDALLVNPRRVAVVSTQGANFTTNLGVVAPGVELKRGWVAVRGQVGDHDVVLVSTHLESGDGAPFTQIRAAQAAELVSLLAGDTPTIVMGDLNDLPGSPMHEIMTGAAFIDAWQVLRPASAGATCCQSANLGNDVSILDRRFDYVMVRGMARHERQLAGRIALVGASARDRVQGPVHPLWLSDHAGVAADLVPARSPARAP